MRRTDALAFLFTAIAVLVVNAVLAVAIDCSFYLAKYIYAYEEAAPPGFAFAQAVCRRK